MLECLEILILPDTFVSEVHICVLRYNTAMNTSMAIINSHQRVLQHPSRAVGPKRAGELRIWRRNRTHAPSCEVARGCVRSRAQV
jgi:hypothetical protein